MVAKPGYENDMIYNARAYDLTDGEIRAVYAKAGLDYETGLPVAKAPAVKIAMCSGVYAAGAFEMNAPYYQLKRSARACMCPSCESALINIRGAAVSYTNNKGAVRLWARQNRQYFIQRLREVIFSQSINHNK